MSIPSMRGRPIFWTALRSFPAEDRVHQDSDIGRLNQIIKAEEALLMKFSIMESRRQKALEMLKNENSINGVINSSVLNEYLEDDDFDLFNAVTERFTVAMRQQKENNEFNKRLLASKLNYIDYILKVIDRKQTGESEYVTNNIIDRRI